ncbi:MAG: BACON domain-containing protein, partial [Caldisericia bacterium]|nr:BACON domain-containing protein [Caldisericia bacterium]
MHKAPTITIDVLPDVTWEVKNIPDWLSVVPSSGQGASTVLCAIIKESEEEIFRENELSIQLKDFPSEVRTVNIQHISPKSFLPDSLTLKSSENIFTGQMICKSFDRNEILIVRQPSNGWFTWIN